MGFLAEYGLQPWNLDYIVWPYEFKKHQISWF